LRLGVSFLSLSPPACVGDGKTLSMSSKELRFATTESFAVGQVLQASLEWPARLDKRIPLTLVVSGRILRSGSGQAVMTIQSFEFKVRGRLRAAERPVRPFAIGA